MALRLAGFGSYRAGGRIEHVSGRPPRDIRFTATTTWRTDPNGAFAVESAYVQYFVPEGRTDDAPVVLLHGGGLTGAMWETTPDGRPGWLQFLLARGREVHVLDNVERGRAGWMPGLWDGEPVLRSLQEAWTLFRLGRAENFAARRPFPGQQFPVEALETFAAGFVPRWTSTTGVQVAALGAVLRRLGRATLVAHSQGGEVAFRAAAAAPDAVAALIAVEPSGFPDDPASLAPVPVTIAHGDHLDTAPIWHGLRTRWHEFAARHPATTITDLATVTPGASHFPMLDRASDAYAAALFDL